MLTLASRHEDYPFHRQSVDLRPVTKNISFIRIFGILSIIRDSESIECGIGMYTGVFYSCRIHDSDRSGTIDFSEFLKLHIFLMNMQKSYQHFDRDGNGELDEIEIGQALQHAGQSLESFKKPLA